MKDAEKTKEKYLARGKYTADQIDKMLANLGNIEFGGAEETYENVLDRYGRIITKLYSAVNYLEKSNVMAPEEQRLPTGTKFRFILVGHNTGLARILNAADIMHVDETLNKFPSAGRIGLTLDRDSNEISVSSLGKTGTVTSEDLTGIVEESEH